MKSITIHKLDEATAKRLEAKAQQDGTSLNQCVKSILRSALGIDAPTPPDWTEMLQNYAGTWTSSDTEEFTQSTAEFGEIDKTLWALQD